MEKKYPRLSNKRKAQAAIRNIIDQSVTDLIDNTKANIIDDGITTLEQVRSNSRPLVSFSSGIKQKMAELKSFLHSNLYQHKQVNVMSENAKKTITVLFESYFEQPCLLPEEHQRKANMKRDRLGEDGFARVISDYIAGMTDRYAEAEYKRLQSRNLR